MAAPPPRSARPATGLRWAALLAALRASGKVMPVKDSLNAATALSHELAIASLNRRDFDAAGVTIVERTMHGKVLRPGNCGHR